MSVQTYSQTKAVSKKSYQLPLNKSYPYTPSRGALSFWERYFRDFDEVSLSDLLEVMVPSLEKEIQKTFTQSQLQNLIQHLDYENNNKFTKYEFFFFIDRVWNNPETLNAIFKREYVTVEQKIGQFRQLVKELKEKQQKETLFGKVNFLSQFGRPFPANIVVGTVHFPWGFGRWNPSSWRLYPPKQPHVLDLKSTSTRDWYVYRWA